MGSLWPRPVADGVAVTATHYETEPGVQVLVHSQRPREPVKGELLLVHGLEGSSDAGYMRSASHAALASGFAVHRLNIRSCGGTEPLCNTLYHAGLTSDVRFVLERLRERGEAPLFLAGFSLGGNMVIKLAGELGKSDLLAGVIGVSVPLDLRACAEALNKPGCWLYQQRFLKNMSARLRRRNQFMPDVFKLDSLEGVRSVYEFDDRITAPFFGFGTADRYYGTQSAGLFLDTIGLPALLIHAKDDPMIPFHVFDRAAFRENRHIELLAVDHGGHVGFLAKGKQRFWVDEVLVDWMSARLS